MQRIRVFIASPYSTGDPIDNIRLQIDASDKLISEGFYPFAGLLYSYQHLVHPRPYSDWVEFTKGWVGICDCLLRLPGKSSGADGEVEEAKINGIPVFYSIEELIKYWKE